MTNLNAVIPILMHLFIFFLLKKMYYLHIPRRGRQHSFVEIDHEIFSTVILSLPLIQEGQLSVSGKRMCTILVCLFVLRFYGPVNPMGSCRALSVYLTTHLLGRLSPLSGLPVLCTFFRQKLTTALLESAEGRE